MSAAYLSDVQVAELLQVDVQVIQRLANRGDLVGFKVGRQWRFTRDAIRRFTGEATPETQMPPQLRGLHMPRRRAS